jgi:branched-chain amino acid transport system ATP-binding protein
MNAMSQTNLPALHIDDLHKSFGKAEIIRGIDLSIDRSERHAIIGPNGAGKSTLFNLITARFPPTSGKVSLHGQDLAGLAPYQINRLGLSRSFQITNIFPKMTVFENIRCGLLWSQGYKYSFWNLVSRSRALNEGADEILEQINLTSRRDLPAGVLSYAEQRALEIGITIAGGADVIMLDEPTAGMSHSETDYIVELIRKVTESKTLVMVEHDMGVVFGLADRISVLVYGEIIATGKPEEVRGNAKVQEAYLGAALEAEH